MSAVTAFEVGGSPPSQLALAASGLGASDGNTVRNESAVGEMIATFITRPTASAGVVQLPFVPRTVTASVSFGPRGVARVPTLSDAGRVSISRHGMIGT